MTGLPRHFRAVAVLLVAVVASPLLAEQATGAAKGAPPPSDRFIVTFLRSTPSGDLASAREAAVHRGGTVHFTFVRTVRGFAATLPPAALTALRKDPRVLSIEPDRPVHATDVQQTPSPWNLDRVDQRRLPLDYSRVSARTGAGVTAFIIDSGIRATHEQFGGRVGRGFTAIKDRHGTGDCDGHGTHVAATVGGAAYGMARAVTLVPVRVLDCRAEGSVSGIIAGVEWVTAHHRGPSVANMSVGTTPSAALDRAVRASIASGVTYVVPAGNTGTNACSVSPGRVRRAITVGASTLWDSRAYFSNHGTCVDLFAPGDDILSADNASDTATTVRNGTSMASALVAGVIATYLEGTPGALPKTVSAALIRAATSDALRDIKPGSPNRLVYSPLGAADPAPPPLGPR